MPLSDDDLVAVLLEAAAAVRRALGALDDWGPAGTVPGQYRSDLAADAAARDVLVGAGLGILSVESRLQGGDRDVVVVLDPLDGSTNAAHGIPWYATSLCAVDGDGPRVAVVLDLPRGRAFTARRGGGATVDGTALAPSGCAAAGEAVVAVSGLPAASLGWRQFRSLGAAALDLCAVAEGVVDAFVDCTTPAAHGPWDYLGGALVCGEAGAVVGDVLGRPLAVLDPRARRTPVAAATPELFSALLAARQRLDAGGRRAGGVRRTERRAARGGQ